MSPKNNQTLDLSLTPNKEKQFNSFKDASTSQLKVVETMRISQDFELDLKKYFPKGSSKGQDKFIPKLSQLPIKELQLLSPSAEISSRNLMRSPSLISKRITAFDRQRSLSIFDQDQKQTENIKLPDIFLLPTTMKITRIYKGIVKQKQQNSDLQLPEIKNIQYLPKEIPQLLLVSQRKNSFEDIKEIEKIDKRTQAFMRRQTELAQKIPKMIKKYEEKKLSSQDLRIGGAEVKFLKTKQIEFDNDFKGGPNMGTLEGFQGSPDQNLGQTVGLSNSDTFFQKSQYIQHVNMNPALINRLTGKKINQDLTETKMTQNRQSVFLGPTPKKVGPVKLRRNSDFRTRQNEIIKVQVKYKDNGSPKKIIENLLNITNEQSFLDTFQGDLTSYEHTKRAFLPKMRN